MEYKKFNPHPQNRRRDDCTIRAIVAHEGRRWIDVYNDLCKLGGVLYDMPNSDAVIEEYLKLSGWDQHKMPKHPSGKRYTVQQFADENPKGKFIIRTTNHLSAVIDGVLYDTWNCGHRSMGRYYRRP